MPFPVSVKNEIAEIFKKNGFECMSPGRGSQNPENWKGLGFHRARDNAWGLRGDFLHWIKETWW